ncbi:MAG: type II secretion system protein [Candidatus Dadabacteria bacterium]|nr:type II secretion system protein [Candidatus Dadabacteria bacterium]MCY4262109.1 type II secretion system protein [Candidatus Dadabacteria bacterium]
MRTKQAGFTLIELLVVIFLLGAFLSVAMPSVLRTDDMKLRSASRGIVTTIRYLYSKAVFEKRIYRLSFNIDTGEYWPEVIEGNQFRVESISGDGPKELPRGVFFSDIQTERTQRKISSGKDAFILFLPTGTVDSAVIHLRAGKDNFFTLSTNPYTGATKVFDEYIEFSDRLGDLAERQAGNL